MGCREGRRDMGPQGLEAQTAIPVRLGRYGTALGMKQARGRARWEPAGAGRAGLGISLPFARTKAVPQMC